MRSEIYQPASENGNAMAWRRRRRGWRRKAVAGAREKWRSCGVAEANK